MPNKPLRLNYQPGDIFTHHIWKTLRVGDIQTVRIRKGRVVVKAKVVKCNGQDKYKMEIIERIK